MEISRESVLERTHYGLNIYAHVLRKYYPGETVLSLAGRDCKPAKNPFNNSKATLWIKIVEGLATHVDTERAIENGDAFDFAALHFKVQGQALYDLLNEEMHLRIDTKHPFYDYKEFDKEKEPVTKKEEIKIPVFSYFKKPITNVNPYGTKSLLEVYELIKGDTFKAHTAKLRSLPDAKEARKYKAFSFDYVTFSGAFSSRSDKNLKAHSGLIVIDFDHLEDLNGLKEQLLNDKHFDTELLFTSPSGDGLKWVIAIDIHEADHQTWFKGIANYLNATYQLQVDESGKDISRACFLPHDPEIFINSKYIGQ